MGAQQSFLYGITGKEMFYTKREKERIFIDRTKRTYPEIWRYYEDLIHNESLSADELRALNFKRRCEILHFAYRNSPFYKKFYDQNHFNPADVKTESDWDVVPVITKQMIREHSEDLKVPGEIDKYGRSNNTGGSTGIPLKLFNDKRDAVPSVYWRYRGWWMHRKPGELSSPKSILGQNEAKIYRPLPNTKNAITLPNTYKPMEMVQLDAQKMDEGKMLDFVNQMKRIKPVYLQGYAGAVYEFANFCKVKRVSFTGLTGVEVVSTPTNLLMRKTMEEVFNCKVFDTYASNESLLIAAECPYSTDEHYLHVFSDIKHIDILDENNKMVPVGTEGVVAITCFNNRVFPFVKYLLGDRTHYIETKCDCGLSFPVIARIQGRESSYLITKDNSKVLGCSAFFDDYPDLVMAFQFVQHRDLSVTLKVVPNKNVEEKEIVNKILIRLQNMYSGRIDFNLKLVNSIPHDGGKIRYIIHE